MYKFHRSNLVAARWEHEDRDVENVTWSVPTRRLRDDLGGGRMQVRLRPSSGISLGKTLDMCEDALVMFKLRGISSRAQ